MHYLREEIEGLPVKRRELDRAEFPGGLDRGMAH